MSKKNALPITREQDFAAWYQSVISEANLAEESGVRGCMVIMPWGYGIWERVQRLMDNRIKAAGIQNCYFPIFIPLSNFEREAKHVEGFAKEMAVVTHHRLIAGKDGGLIPDPEAKLEEPLVVRPTSETIIGDAMARWVQSWRDLPLLTNQWANVVRWEMRTRMFLRTTEFLWQEGHTAHENREQALEETHRAIEMYRECAEEDLAIPVIVGEKPENERFPGAVETWSIEAMMQDGKALQAGTSHYLGTNFSDAASIRYQDREGAQQFCHTTSWGFSTRMIGAIIMTHGDDDGLRVPPLIAPHQVVIIPMLRDNAEDDDLLDYCQKIAEGLKAQTAFDEPVRVYLDKTLGKAANKRWSWIKKGAPLILEIGGRDAAGEQVTMMRRDALYNAESGRLDNKGMNREEFVGAASGLLETIQKNLHAEATERLQKNIRKDITDIAQLSDFYKKDKMAGWVQVQWSKPTGEALEKVVEQLKKLKLTIRNTPQDADPVDGACFFTGDPAVEHILIGRAY